jgi:hypothetical protein
MENLPTSRIYQIALSLVAFLIFVFTALHFWERSLSQTATRENAPTVSALGEVEFESGATAQALRENQNKALHAYAPAAGAVDQKNYQQVPIERAFEQLLKPKESP